MKEELKIYMSGYAGSLWAARFASDNKPLLQKRFRPDYMEAQMKMLEQDVAASSEKLPSIIDEIYRIAHETQQGFAVELRKIPVRQFTIELCELAGLDPYRVSSNARLYTERNRRMEESIQAEDIKTAQVRTEAVCIGWTTEGRDITLLR